MASLRSKWLSSQSRTWAKRKMGMALAGGLRVLDGDGHAFCVCRMQNLQFLFKIEVGPNNPVALKSAEHIGKLYKPAMGGCLGNNQRVQENRSFPTYIVRI